MKKPQKNKAKFVRTFTSQYSRPGTTRRSRTCDREGGIIRRILALAICFAMILSMSGVNTLTSYAAEKAQNDGIIFIFSGGEGEEDKNSEDKDAVSGDQSGKEDQTVDKNQTVDEGQAADKDQAVNEDQDSAQKEKEVSESTEHPKEDSSSGDKSVQGPVLKVQTLTAELVSGPTAGDKLDAFGRSIKRLFGIDKSAEPVISVSGMLPEGAQVKAYPVNVEVPGQEVLVAFDITIYAPESTDKDARMVEWQPDDSLKVNISDDAISSEKGSVKIFHMEDRGAEPEYVQSTTIDKGAVEFEAENFSVYVVSQDQKGFIYKFVSPEGTEYTELRQTLFDGDTLVKPTDPVDNGRKFDHWEENGQVFNGWGVVHVASSQTGMEEHTVTAMFTDSNVHKYHVTYYDQNNNVLTRETLSKDARMDPNGQEDESNKVPYAVIQQSNYEYLTFLYWTEDLYEHVGGKPVEFQAEDLNRDIELFPYCVPAHWLYFNGNRAAADNNSVTYTAPKLILTGEVPASVGVPTTENGYTFKGWFTKAADIDSSYMIFNASGKPVDLDGNEVDVSAGASAIASTAFAKKLYTGGDSLDYDPTLYAHWEKATAATYNIAYYIQQATDEHTATDAAKKYDYYVSHTFTGGTLPTGAVGSEVSVDSNGNVVVGETDSGINIYTADQLSAALPNRIIPGGAMTLNTVRTVPVKIKPDGTTVLNVYFDRKAYTITFWDTQAHAVNHNANTTGKKYTITAIYGHSIASQWKTCVNNRLNNTQWLRCHTTGTNETIRFTMPMPDEVTEARFSDTELSYYDPTTNYTVTYNRRAFLENVDNDGFTENENYLDSRKLSIPCLAIFNGSLMNPIIGFDLIRVDGVKQCQLVKIKG